MVFRIGVKWG